MGKRSTETGEGYSSRKKKHPSAPKRCKSAYMFFTMEKRQSIMDELGPTSNKVTDVAKKSSGLWKSLLPEEKAKYEKMAQDDQERYKAEKAEYKGPLQIATGKSSSKDENAPKRPMSAFLFFSQEKRPEVKDRMPNLKYTEVAQELGRMWRDLSDVQRKPYVDHEAGQRKIYKEKMSEWKVEQAEIEKEEKKKRLADERREKKQMEKMEKIKELERLKEEKRMHSEARTRAAAQSNIPSRAIFGDQGGFEASDMASMYGQGGGAPTAQEQQALMYHDPYYGHAYSQQGMPQQPQYADGLGNYGGQFGLAHQQAQAQYDQYFRNGPGVSQGLGGSYPGGSMYGYNPSQMMNLGGSSSSQYGNHLGYYPAH